MDTGRSAGDGDVMSPGDLGYIAESTYVYSYINEAMYAVGWINLGSLVIVLTELRSFGSEWYSKSYVMVLASAQVLAHHSYASVLVIADGYVGWAMEQKLRRL